MKLNKKFIIIIIFILIILMFCVWKFRWYGIGFSNPKWSDSIKVKGITYVVESIDDKRQEISSDEIGENYAKIKFKLSGNIRNTLYKMRNDDATLLDVGTLIFTIKDQQPGEKLAAKIGDKYFIYSKSHIE